MGGIKRKEMAFGSKGFFVLALTLLFLFILALPHGFAWADEQEGEANSGNSGAELINDENSGDDDAGSNVNDSEEPGIQPDALTPVKSINCKVSATGTASFSWAANPESQAVEGYEVRARTKGSSSWTSVSTVKNCSWNTTVASGKAIEFQVRALRTNANGETEYGQAASCSSSIFVAAPKNLSSTMSLSKKTISLEWDAPKVANASSVKYEIRWRVAGSSSWTTKSTSKTSYTVTGLKKNKAYELQVITVAVVDGKKCSSSAVISRRHMSTATASASFNSSYVLKASASSDYSYSGLEISTAIRGGKTIKTDLKTGSSTKISFAKGNLVTVRARTYVVIDGQRYTGMWGSKIYRAAYTTDISSSLSYSKKTLTITSSKFNSNTGTPYYRIQYRKGTAGSWSSKTTTSNSRKVTSLSTGSLYQARVAPVVKVNGVSYVGAYDYTYRYSSKTSITSLTDGGTSRTIKYSKVSGATGYQIRYSTNSSFSNSKTITVSGASATKYTVSNLNSSKAYYFKVRAIKTSGGKTYYGPWATAEKSDISYKSQMTSKAQGYSSSTKWLILVDTSKNKVAVFNGSKGNWTLKKYWDCTSGASSSPTVTGTFKVQAKGMSFGSGYTCWYYTQFYGNYLFHSVLYNQGSKTSIQDGRLGINASHGCVRLSINNAKWIYDNIPRNTKVVIYR